MSKEHTSISLDTVRKNQAKLLGINLSELFNRTLEAYLHHRVDNPNAKKKEELLKEKHLIETSLIKSQAKLTQLNIDLHALEIKESEDQQKRLKEMTAYAKAYRNSAEFLDNIG